MATPKESRITTRNWSFTLQCPAANADAVRALIDTRYIECIKLRKEGDLKASVVESKVEYLRRGDMDGGVQTFFGDIKLRHRSSIHSLSFAQLRTIIATSLALDKIHIRLDERKIEKVVPVAAEVKNAAPIEVKVEPERKEDVVMDPIPTAGDALRKVPVKVEAKVEVPVESPIEIKVLAIPVEPIKEPEPVKLETKVPEPVKPEVVKPEPKAEPQKPTKQVFTSGAVAKPKTERVTHTAGRLPPRIFGFTTPEIMDTKK